MSKDHKMMDLIGHINNKYIDEATHAKKLDNMAVRRFSLGNIAAVVVGLVAVSFVTLMAFWLSGNLGEHPANNGSNGYEIGTPTPNPVETPGPVTTPAPSGDAARAHAGPGTIIAIPHHLP